VRWGTGAFENFDALGMELEAKATGELFISETI